MIRALRLWLSDYREGLPYNQTTITLERESWVIPQSVPFDDSDIVPLAAGNQLNWRLKS